MKSRTIGRAPSPLKLAGTVVQFVIAQLEQFAGGKTLSSVGNSLPPWPKLAGVLSDRFRAIQALLRSPAVQFVLVTTAEANRLAEARAVVKRMDPEGLRLGAIVVNRLVDQRSFGAFSAHPGKTGERCASVPLARRARARSQD